MNRFYNILLIGFISIFVVSCAGSRHGNFNKQKFTKLKSIKNHHEDVASSDDCHHDDKIENEEISNEQTFNTADFLSDNATETELTQEVNDATSDEQQYSTSQDWEVNSEDATARKREPQWRERRNFNRLSSKQKKEALRQFNAIFNSGLFLFILGALLLIAYGLFLISNIWSSWIFFFLGIGLTFIFTIWIMSMAALNRVRKIDLSTRSRRFIVKYRLAQVVAYIGVLTCVVTILGGIVLLILWAARIISF